MAKLQLLVQLSPGTTPKWHLAENPAWIDPMADQAGGGEQIIAFTPPLAVDQAWIIGKRLDKHVNRIARLWALLPWPKLLAWWAARFLRLSFPGYPRRLPTGGAKGRRLDPDQRLRLVEAARQLLKGRLVPDNLLENELRAQGWWPADIHQALDWGMRERLIAARPGVMPQVWGELRCSRCQSPISELRPCIKCGRNDCPVCLACTALGEIRGCTCLWFLDNRQLPGNKVAVNQDSMPRLQMGFDLTAAQAQASHQLVQFMDSSATRLLVWAACGAGKTEVTFAAIQVALARGLQVLFAIPRRDVVRELAERLAAAFPETRLAIHYGGQPWLQEGPLVIATTHQTLRFYNRFGLAILDEVDAYPYHGSEMLRVGVEQALTKGGKLIEMTATPYNIDPKAKLITIPARYHGYPLPEPRIVKVRLPALNELVETKLPEDVIGIIQANNSPWLIFAPTVSAVKLIAASLAQTLGRMVCGSWAADPRRDQKIDGFIRGRYEVMVATSIMERGITLANVQVMVLYSDHVVFDTNSLIQMAGRVGRKAEHPSGEVWFIGARITEAMQAAVKRIQYLNQQARQQGLLTGGTHV